VRSNFSNDQSDGSVNTANEEQQIIENDFSNFAAFIEELQMIDPDSDMALLNATTISDNNGGHILL
jgi:hypothetical protein